MKAMKPMEAIPGMTGPVPNFKGLPLPEGVDRHNLYQSAFRVVTTYAMPLADLDNELKAILTKSGARQVGSNGAQGDIELFQI